MWSGTMMSDAVVKCVPNTMIMGVGKRTRTAFRIRREASFEILPRLHVRDGYEATN
jgi:hypothetical protein